MTVYGVIILELVLFVGHRNPSQTITEWVYWTCMTCPIYLYQNDLDMMTWPSSWLASMLTTRPLHLHIVLQYNEKILIKQITVMPAKIPSFDYKYLFLCVSPVMSDLTHYLRF